jgi:quercetin dioxygenase-like cupin family protein
VVEGAGRFTIGDEVRSAGPGAAVWASAGVPHAVRNDTNERLVLLVGIAPFSGGS